MTTTGSHFLFSKLNTVRWRLRSRHVLHGVAAGLFWGAVLGCMIAAGCAVGLRVPEWMAWGVPTLSMLAGGLYCGFQPVSNCDAGKLIDAVYGLQDRLVTAIEFSAEPKADPMQALQLVDAIERARWVDPKLVVPRLLPVQWLSGIGVIGSLVLVSLFLLTPLQNAEPPGARASTSVSVNLSDGIQRTMVASLRQQAEDAPPLEPPSSAVSFAQTPQRLAALADEIEALAQDLDRPTTGRHAALTRLSEMQAAIARTQLAFQRSVIEPQLKALGQSLAAEQSTQKIGKPLAEGNVAEAAAALEQLDLQILRGPDRRSLARKLRWFGRRFTEAELTELAAATEQLLKKFEAASPSAEPAQNSLARLLREYATRWSAEQYLEAQLRAISDARAALTLGESSLDPGLREIGAPSLLTGVPGVVPADRLTLSQRELQRLSGTAGSGPSSWKTTLVNPDRESAERPLVPNDVSTQKRTEEAPELEALPLGYRQTIRRYFQSLNP